MTDNAPLGPGYLLAGRYRLSQRLGRGGMSTVWQAVDEVLGRDVAVKVVAETDDAEVTAERFRREAQATAALNHPNIVTVFDAGVDAGRAFLVMELLPGATLADELRSRGAFPVDEVRDIAVQVTGALDAAHRAGLVHRDIKPGNIARTADGGVKVVDFGISHIIDEATSDTHHPLTATGTVIGTAAYLAPEQGRGERVDQRADLYALGCVLYALLTGKPPFQGPTAVSTMMLHATDPVPDLGEVRPEVPQELAAVVHTLLAKDPESRPQSAAAVGAAIQAQTTEAVTELLPAGEYTTTVPASGLPAPARASLSDGPDPSAPAAAPARAVVDPDHQAASYDEPEELLPLEEEEEDGGRRGVIIGLVVAAVALLAGFTWWLLNSSPNLTTTPEPTAAVPASESPTPTPTELATEPTALPTLTDPTGRAVDETPTPLEEPTIAEQPTAEPVVETVAPPATQAPPPPPPTTQAPPRTQAPPPATQAPPPGRQDPPGSSSNVDQAAQAVQAAADELSRAVRDVTTGGNMDNKHRKAIDAGLRDLAKALRNQDEDAANRALDRVDDALSDSGFEDQLKSFYDRLKDRLDDWDDLV